MMRCQRHDNAKRIQNGSDGLHAPISALPALSVCVGSGNLPSQCAAIETRSMPPGMTAYDHGCGSVSAQLRHCLRQGKCRKASGRTCSAAPRDHHLVTASAENRSRPCLDSHNTHAQPAACPAATQNPAFFYECCASGPQAHGHGTRARWPNRSDKPCDGHRRRSLRQTNASNPRIDICRDNSQQMPRKPTVIQTVRQVRSSYLRTSISNCVRCDPCRTPSRIQDGQLLHVKYGNTSRTPRSKSSTRQLEPKVGTRQTGSSPNARNNIHEHTRKPQLWPKLPKNLSRKKIVQIIAVCCGFVIMVPVSARLQAVRAGRPRAVQGSVR